MKIKLEALIAILSYINGNNKLFICHALQQANSIWICENDKSSKFDGEVLMFNLATNEVSNVSMTWRYILEEFRYQSGEEYGSFIVGMNDFVKMVPEHTWFIDNQKEKNDYHYEMFMHQ